MFRLSITISAALCLACAALVWSSIQVQRTPERGEAAPVLTWAPGARQHYRLATDVWARMHLAGSAQPLPMQAHLSGVLELAVEDAGEAGARLRFRLAPAEYTTSGAPDRAAEIGLSTPFHADFRADGLPLSFEFPPELGDEARSVLEELVRTFQVVVAAQSGGWTAREENATGAYLADYRVARDGTLRKVKTGFETVNESSALGTLDVRILRSSARVRLEPGASWVELVELEEETRVLAGGKPMLDSKLVATLARTEAPRIPEPRSVRSAAELTAAEDAAPAQAKTLAPPAPFDPDELARLLTGLEQSGGKSTAAVHALRDAVALHPEAAETVRAALAAGALGDLPAAAAIHALQLAGTPAAQTALASIVAGDAFGRADRLRAVLALGGLERPATPEALDALWSATSQRHSDEAVELADTSLLALGALAPAEHAAAGVELEAQELGRVEARLLAHLAAAGDEDERGILLGALGNAQNPALAATVTPWLDGDSAYVRASAADALGNMPSPAVEVALAARLEQEPNAHVRASLASALRRMPEPSLASLVLVQSLVAREESDSARVEMAGFLAAHVDTFPAARETLDELMQSDRSPRVRSTAAEALLRPRDGTAARR